MNNMESTVRQIVAELGTEVATARMVKTIYKERNSLKVLSEEEKTNIRFYLNKIVDELMSCTAALSASQASFQPESFPTKSEKSGTNVPDPNSNLPVTSPKGRCSESATQDNAASALHQKSTDSIVSRVSSKVMNGEPQFQGGVEFKSGDEHDGFVENETHRIKSETFSGGRKNLKITPPPHHHHHHVEKKREKRGRNAQGDRNVFESILQKRCQRRDNTENCNPSKTSSVKKLNAMKLGTKFDCFVSLQNFDRFLKDYTDSDSECDPSFSSFKVRKYISAAAARQAILESDSESDQMMRKQIVIESDSENVQTDVDLAVMNSNSEGNQQTDVDLEVYSACDEGSQGTSVMEGSDYECDHEDGDTVLSVDDEVRLKKTPCKSQTLSAADIRRAILNSDSESHVSDVSSVMSSPVKFQGNSVLLSDNDNSPFLKKRKKKRMAAISESESDAMDTEEADCNETLTPTSAEGIQRDSISDDEAESEEDQNNPSTSEISESDINDPQDEDQEHPRSDGDDLDITLVRCEENASLSETASSKDSGIAVQRNKLKSKNFKRRSLWPKYDKSSEAAVSNSTKTLSETNTSERKRLGFSKEHVFDDGHKNVKALKDSEHERKTKRRKTSSKRKRSDHGNIESSSSKRTKIALGSRSESNLSQHSSSFQHRRSCVQDVYTLSDSNSATSPSSSRLMVEHESDLSDLSESEETKSDGEGVGSSQHKLRIFTSDDDSDVALAVIQRSLASSDKDNKSSSGKENRKKRGPTTKTDSSNDNQHAKKLEYLRKICRCANLVLRNTIELKGCDTTLAKVERIERLLEEKGMTGRPTLKKARQFLLEKELKELGSAMNAVDDASDVRSSRSRSRTSQLENSDAVCHDGRERKQKDQIYGFSHLSDIFTADDSSDCN